jgi:hypothetical protein
MIFNAWGAAMDTQDWGRGTSGISRLPSGSGEADAAASSSRLANCGTARADHIGYIADMIQEMNVLADRMGCATLAGILQLAHSEALREVSRR